MLSLKKIEWPNFSYELLSCVSISSRKTHFWFNQGNIWGIWRQIHGVWRKRNYPMEDLFHFHLTPWILNRLNKNKMEMPSQYFGFGNILPVPLPPHTHTVFPTLNFGMNKDQLPPSPFFGTCYYPLVIYLFRFYCYIYNISGQWFFKSENNDQIRTQFLILVLIMTFA